MSGQTNQPVDCSGAGVGGADGQPQHQPVEGTASLMGTDQQFVMLRTAMREGIFELLRRKQSPAEWQERLPELAKRLEEILYVKFPNRNDYNNMMKGPVEPQLQFAIKTLSAQCQQHQQNPLVARTTPSSSSTDMLVDSNNVGVGGANGQPQHQLMEGMAGVPGKDQQFVMLRTAMRQRIFEYIGRRHLQADWWNRLPELAKRLEEILYRKFPNRNDYYNMMKGPIEPQLQFAIRTLSAMFQQNQQNPEVARQTPSSSSTYPAVDHDGHCELIASLQANMQQLMLVSTTKLNDSSPSMETD